MYYQGDYYQGDYYQGDPFFGALIGGAVSWLGKKIFKRGLSKGAQATAGTAIVRKTGQLTRRVALPAVGAAAIASKLTSIPLPGPYVMNLPAAFPGGSPFIRREGPAAAAPAGAMGGVLPERLPPDERWKRPLCAESIDERGEPSSASPLTTAGRWLRQDGAAGQEGHPSCGESDRSLTRSTSS